MVIETICAGVAGGITSWIRSPPGSDAESKGNCSSIRCWVALATSLHRRRHQSKPANVSGTLCQPAADSTYASPGRLMHSSVTPSAPRTGSRSRSVSASADCSNCDTGASLRMGCPGFLQLIDLPEVKVACDQNLDPITLVLGDGRRNADGAAQCLRGNIAGRGRIVDDGSGSSRTLRGLGGTIDQGDEYGRTKSLPEVPIDLAVQTGATQRIRSR